MLGPSAAAGAVERYTEQKHNVAAGARGQRAASGGSVARAAPSGEYLVEGTPLDAAGKPRPAAALACFNRGHTLHRNATSAIFL